MKFSLFGQLMAQPSPIFRLMEDLGAALNDNPDMLFLGGGNPAQVPAAQACFARHLSRLASDHEAQRSVLGVYQSPQGNSRTLVRLAEFFKSECSWNLQPENIALVSGSQTAFFILLNLFAGEVASGGQRQIVLPLVPEYLGYGSQTLKPGQFRSLKPDIHQRGEHRFKYAVDFDQLTLGEEDGAVCISRPTNPSGNLITDEELRKLAALAKAQGLPLIVDLAYGSPFPGVVYRDCTPIWQSGMIAVLSLSKLGLPGARTAVVVADEAVIQAVAQANTVISLANGNIGPYLLEQLMASGDLRQLAGSVLPEFYRARRDQLVELLDKHLQGLSYRLHEPEGAFFVWLWFEQLPITSRELYERLKRRGVLVMPGEPFFFGFGEHWDHARQCLRLTYCQEPEVLERAVQRIAEETKRAYGEG